MMNERYVLLRRAILLTCGRILLTTNNELSLIMSPFSPPGFVGYAEGEFFLLVEERLLQRFFFLLCV